MYVRIANPNIAIYNGLTNNFIADGRFQFSPESEQAILDLVNYNKVPEKLLLLNLFFYQQSAFFDPPTPDSLAKRKGIIRAIFTNESGEQVPMEIRLEYDAIARGNTLGSRYFFDSVEYDNIRVISVEPVAVW